MRCFKQVVHAQCYWPWGTRFLWPWCGGLWSPQGRDVNLNNARHRKSKIRVGLTCRSVEMRTPMHAWLREDKVMSRGCLPGLGESHRNRINYCSTTFSTLALDLQMLLRREERAKKIIHDVHTHWKRSIAVLKHDMIAIPRVYILLAKTNDHSRSTPAFLGSKARRKIRLTVNDQ